MHPTTVANISAWKVHTRGTSASRSRGMATSCSGLSLPVGQRRETQLDQWSTRLAWSMCIILNSKSYWPTVFCGSIVLDDWSTPMMKDYWPTVFCGPIVLDDWSTPLMKDYWSTIFRGPIVFSSRGSTVRVDQQSGIRFGLTSKCLTWGLRLIAGLNKWHWYRVSRYIIMRVRQRYENGEKTIKGI